MGNSFKVWLKPISELQQVAYFGSNSTTDELQVLVVATRNRSFVANRVVHFQDFIWRLQTRDTQLQFTDEMAIVNAFSLNSELDHIWPKTKQQ